jgi:hypothetical protein
MLRAARTSEDRLEPIPGGPYLKATLVLPATRADAEVGELDASQRRTGLPASDNADSCMHSKVI